MTDFVSYYCIAIYYSYLKKCVHKHLYHLVLSFYTSIQHPLKNCICKVHLRQNTIFNLLGYKCALKNR